MWKKIDKPLSQKNPINPRPGMQINPRYWGPKFLAPSFGSALMARGCFVALPRVPFHYTRVRPQIVQQKNLFFFEKYKNVFLDIQRVIWNPKPKVSPKWFRWHGW